MPETVLENSVLENGVQKNGVLENGYELTEQVALRPEPFGALAYHYGNRRLVFLRHPDLLEVVNHLGRSGDLRSCLEHCGIDPERWPSFCAAIESLIADDMLRPRATPPNPAPSGLEVNR